MDRINYLTNSTTSQNGKFPVTIQGLDFIQKQILLLQNQTLTGGGIYILKNSTVSDPGVLVVDGEIFPLIGVRSVKATHIRISTTLESIRTDSGDYESVRSIRTATWVTRNDPNEESDDLKPIKYIEAFKTNSYLWGRMQELLTSNKEYLEAESGIFTLVQLDSKKSPARITCQKGSAYLCGSSAYTVDVYACGDGIFYQELKSKDLRRYGRYFNPTNGTWGKFEPLDDQMQLEAKVIRGTLYLRHGFLPPYANIIVLRKKRRSKNAGMGRHVRSVKCAYYHSWKMVFSKGLPNTWYIPKCTSADDKFSGHIGKEFSPLMSELLYIPFVKNGRQLWRLAGVAKKWDGSTTRAYAKLEIATIAGSTHNMPSSGQVRLKYRVWTDLSSGKAVVRKGLSVE